MIYFMGLVFWLFIFLLFPPAAIVMAVLFISTWAVIRFCQMVFSKEKLEK